MKTKHIILSAFYLLLFLGNPMEEQAAGFSGIKPFSKDKKDEIPILDDGLRFILDNLFSTPSEQFLDSIKAPVKSEILYNVEDLENDPNYEGNPGIGEIVPVGNGYIILVICTLIYTIFIRRKIFAQTISSEIQATEAPTRHKIIWYIKVILKRLCPVHNMQKE